MSLPHLVKKLVRPLVPDRVVARYRLERHSRYSRVNVDVFLDHPAEARRWLGTTPDTYRVRMSLPDSGETTEFVTVGDEDLPVDQDQANRAVVVLGDPDIAAGVVAEVDGPRLVGRRRTEPVLAPRLIAVRQSVLEEVGGVPAGEHPLPGLLTRIRDAGHRIGLLPLPLEGAPWLRTDPITLPPVVIMAAVPLHDIGGGARSTQLALELVRQGRHVTVVHLYEAQETVDLGLRYIHPDLEQVRVERFDPDHLEARVERSGLVLVEAPAPELADPALELHRRGWTLVYDLIDDWSDPALGGDWYRAGVERELVAKADRVVASAPDLAVRAEAMGRSAEVIPNAVNADLFGGLATERPEDLPDADLLIGYHGSLYGDWFDWEALRRVARAHPEAAVVLIGDPKAPPAGLPDNVHLLGLKPQTALPGYVQRFDVGLIPFRVTGTTHAVSPLKAYEYLASGVPIAAPPLRALEELEGVHVSDDLVEAVAAALAAPRPDRDRALREHSWAARVRALLGEGPGDAAPVRVVQRPVVHWPPEARLVPAPTGRRP